MDTATPVGHRISRLGGLFEREDSAVHAKHYSAALSLDNGSIFLLGQAAVIAVADWPDDAGDMPAQILNGRQDVVGDLITHAVVRYRHGISAGANGPQLFLILEGERMMGVVPTQRGALLHVESILTSPVLREEDVLKSLDGKEVSLDDIVAM